MPAKKDQLSILIPDVTVPLSVGDVVLKPFRFKHSKVALGLIKRYASILFDDVEEELEGRTIKRAKTTAEMIDEVLAEDNDDYPVLKDIVLLLGLASDALPPEKVDELGYDDVFLLLAEIIEQNRDFFRRLMAKVNPPQEPEKTEAEKPKTTASESAA